jgi:DNA-binding NarL/FixJ family response regulator
MGTYLDAAGSDLPRELPLVGRREELARLHTLFGHGSRVEPMILMAGDPGVGKTRMCRALAAEAERRGWTVAEGRAYPVESGMPYSLIADAFLPILREFDEAALTVLTRGTSGDIRQLFPALGRAEPPSNDGWAPGEAKTRLFWSFTEFVKRLAERAPVLIVAEDLHWADASSLSLLHFLTRQLQGEPIRILATASRGYGQGLEALDRFERSLSSLNVLARHPLPPLTLEATEELLHEVFQVRGSPLKDFAAHLFQWTHGNPYFLEETLKALVHTGRLYRRDGTWLGWDVERLDLPGSVRDALLLRLRALSPNARSVADLVAVSGGRAALRVVEAVGDLDTEEVTTAVTELTAQSVIDESEDDRDIFLDFRHPMLRETLYQDLGPSRRRLLHRTLAEGLERAYQGSHPPVDQLAYHFERGGEATADPRAVRYLADAGRAALRRHADREGVAYLSTALARYPETGTDIRTGLDATRATGAGTDAEPVPRSEVQEQLARGLARLGRHEEAAAIWRELLGEAERRGSRMSAADALRHLGLVGFWSGHHEAAITEYDAAMEVLGGELKKPYGARALEVRVLLARGVALQELGRADEGRACIEESLERARALDDAMLLGRAHRALALLYTWIGEADEARRHGWQAIELADRAGDPYVRFWGRWALASLEGLTGNTGEMKGLMGQALHVAEELRSPVLKLWTAELEVEFAYATGDWDGALARGESAIRLATNLSQSGLLPRLLVWTSMVYIGRGDLARARKLADRAWTQAGLDGSEQDRADVHVGVPAHIGRMACLVAEGRWDEAVEVGEAGIELADRAGYVFWTLHFLLPLLAEAHLRRRDLDRAREAGARMRAEGARIGHRLATAWGHACEALVIWLTGEELGPAIEMLRAGAESLEEIPLIYDAARIRRQLAGRLFDAGRKDESAAELRRVHATFHQLGAQPELEATREMFREQDLPLPSLRQQPGSAQLTSREWEVALCVASRMSNKAIAKELGMKERTATTHLTRIYRKLDIRNRQELGDIVREGRLPPPETDGRQDGGVVGT